MTPPAPPPPTNSPAPLTIETRSLTPEQVEGVARHGGAVELGSQARAALVTGRARLETILADGKAHYGINTGFGSLAKQRIADDKLRDLQRNLIRSHAAGVGEPLSEETVRGMMLLLAASQSRGVSGVRPEIVESLVGMLNAGVTPVVPSVGSVGASGDLAPLAHVALVLMGEGEATLHGERISGGEAMSRTGVPTVELEAKEGLALINGTHLMAAEGALLVRDFERLVWAAMLATAMSVDACRASDSFLDPRVHEARNQPGQIKVAARIRELLTSSEIVPSHKLNDPRVQDPYSFRCAPVVLGAALDAFGYVEHAVECELGGVTDNPLVFEGPGEVADVVSAGNFHGMPVALSLDVLGISISHVAGIAERRVYHMLSGFDPEAGLSPFLSPDPGLHSGMMIAQYAAAACCNELIGLANPASVANLSTSAGMEDYNSFGPRSAAKARRAVALARRVVAIELLSGCEALRSHRPLRSGDAIERAHDAIRKHVPELTEDRPPSPDIELVARLIETGQLEAEVAGSEDIR